MFGSRQVSLYRKNSFKTYLINFVNVINQVVQFLLNFILYFINGLISVAKPQHLTQIWGDAIVVEFLAEGDDLRARGLPVPAVNVCSRFNMLMSSCHVNDGMVYNRFIYIELNVFYYCCCSGPSFVGSCDSPSNFFTTCSPTVVFQFQFTSSTLFSEFIQ